MKKLIAVLLTLALLLGLAACGSAAPTQETRPTETAAAPEEPAPPEATAEPEPEPEPEPYEPVLDALATLPAFDKAQSVAMSNWAAYGVCLIEDGRYYGRHFTEDSKSADVMAIELANDGGVVSTASWRILDGDCYPNYLCKLGDTLFYAAISEDGLVGIARVDTDGGDRRLLYEGNCDYLSLFDGRLYFTGEGARLFSMDPDGGDLQLLIDREIYYPYMLSADWLLFQDDADNESLHLLHLPTGIELKLNDEISYTPILIGRELFYTAPCDESLEKCVLARIDLSSWEEVYDEALGCHVPAFTVEHGEKLLGYNLCFDGEQLVPSNNFPRVPLTEWKDLTDDAWFKGYNLTVRFISDEYEVWDSLDPDALVEAVWVYDRAAETPNQLLWVK